MFYHQPSLSFYQGNNFAFAMAPTVVLSESGQSQDEETNIRIMWNK